MTDSQGPETPSDVVARNVRAARRLQEWSGGRLAEECAKLGYPQLTESVIANIETGRRDQDGRRRRDVTVDELVALAEVLEIAPDDLLLGEPPGTPMHIFTAEELDVMPAKLRQAAEAITSIKEAASVIQEYAELETKLWVESKLQRKEARDDG